MAFLSEINESPDNPRSITDERFLKLCDSLQAFPKMIEIRPITYSVNENQKIALGGNMRLRALKHLGFDEVPDSWVKDVSHLTLEEQKRFVITDNVGYGEWDLDILAAKWEIEDLSDWGLEMPDLPEYKATKDIPDLGEIEFSENLLLEHNYVVLYFNNPMDWQVAMDKFGLKKVKTNTPEKSQKVGVGRVLNGKRFL